MRLMDFPMDGHACPLRFGSCEYHRSVHKQNYVQTHIFAQSFIAMLAPPCFCVFRCLHKQRDHVHMEEGARSICRVPQGVHEPSTV